MSTEKLSQTRVIVIASRKGGVGKTTICGSLAVAATLEGKTAVMLDMDEQGSLSQWWNARESDMPVFANTALPDLESTIKQLREAGVDYVFIDTAPGMGESNRAALDRIVRSADLVVVPTRPSPHDLRAVGATIELVEAAGRRMLFVINGAAHRAKITGDAAVALSQYGTVAPVTLYQRTDFASSMTDGRTVQELDPDSRSADEVAKLWQYVSKQVRK